MYVAKKHEHVVSASAPTAFDALTRAVEELGHDVKQADERSLSLQFQAKRGFMTVRVAMKAIVVDAGDGQTKISVTGKPAGREWTAWGEERGVSRDVFRKVDEILPALEDAKPTAASTPPEHAADDAVTSALERLAALRSSGAIDDDEFKLAKARLLRESRSGSTTTQAAPADEGRTTARIPVTEAAAAGVLGGALTQDVATATATPDAEPSESESDRDEVVEQTGNGEPADEDENGIPYDLFG